MSDTKDALFQLMRFNVMKSFVENSEGRNFTPSYVYAWDQGVFPINDTGADWHKPFADQFEISESQIAEVLKFLDEVWLEKKTISFYELEDHYEVRLGGAWDRSILLACCRYLWLHGHLFDDNFWAALVKNGECPSEAHSICRPLRADDVYFN